MSKFNFGMPNSLKGKVGFLTDSYQEEDAVSDALRNRRLKLASKKIQYKPTADDFEAEPLESSLVGKRNSSEIVK